jgi:aminopeptidase N
VSGRTGTLVIGWAATRLTAVLAAALAAAALPAALARAQEPVAGAARDTLHPYQPGIDALDYAITLDLPERGRAIEGTVALAVRRQPWVDTLVLDLVGLRVRGVSVNGRGVGFRRDSTTVRVPLGAPRAGGAASIGDSLLVTVRYGGEPSDGLIVSTDARGRWQAFGDNWPNRARHWIPSVDHPSDKATVTWTVRAPRGRRVVANGTLVEEAPLPGKGAPRTRTRWRESRPIAPYLMVIAAAPLARYDLDSAACGRVEGRAGCLRQQVYVAPEVTPFLPGPFAQATSMVDFFSALVAPFPYEKLAHLQSATRYGGMENASAIFYADAPFRDRTMGTGVVAHETAHQWFGDAVTEREWGHLWLSEGFATYFEKLWTRHAMGDSAFRAGMAEIRDEVVKSPVTAERPVLDTAERDYMQLLNSNSYQKGGWTLHMLRAQVGDSAFFRGVRAYYLAHRHGTALTADLQRAVEEASGQQLGWFFDQWLRRPGVVEAQVAWRWDPGERRLVLDVTQEGRFPPYRFPLPLAVVDSAGRAHTVTVEVPAERRARLTPAIALDGPPRQIAADPDVTVLGTVSVVGGEGAPR